MPEEQWYKLMIRMPRDIAQALKHYADRDRRSFTSEAVAMLEFALVQRRLMENRLPENITLDMTRSRERRVAGEE